MPSNTLHFRSHADAAEPRALRGWTRISPLALAVSGLVLAVFIAAVVVCWAKGVDYGILSRDAVQVMHARFYTGYLSSFGAVLMCAAATACFLAALAVPSRQGETVGRNFLVASGSLTALIMADDLFLLHERAFPMLLGIPERAVLIGYIVAAVTYLLHYRAQLLRTRVLPLLFALVAFAVANFCDVVLDGMKLYVLEDGPKLIGYGAWCGYFLDTSIVRIRGGLAVTQLAGMSTPAEVAKPDDPREPWEAVPATPPRGTLRVRT